MPEQKEISEGTTIKLTITHIFTFLGALIGLLVAVIGFFYAMLNSNIAKKVDEKVYTIEKKFLDKNDSDLNNNLSEIASEIESTNKSLQNIAIDIAAIKAKQNMGNGNNNSMNSNPGNNLPANPNPTR